MPNLRISPVIATLLALVLSACATSPAASSGTAAPAPAAGAPSTPVADNIIPITVNYNMSDQGQLTIYIEPTGGIRTVLGTIQPNEQKTFNFRVTASRNIRLAAISDAGNSGLNSPTQTVPTGQSVVWDMALNNMRLRR